MEIGGHASPALSRGLPNGNSGVSRENIHKILRFSHGVIGTIGWLYEGFKTRLCAQ